RDPRRAAARRRRARRAAAARPAAPHGRARRRLDGEPAPAHVGHRRLRRARHHPCLRRPLRVARARRGRPPARALRAHGGGRRAPADPRPRDRRRPVARGDRAARRRRRRRGRRARAARPALRRAAIRHRELRRRGVAARGGRARGRVAARASRRRRRPRHRPAPGVSPMRHLTDDLRFAFRYLRRRPAFAFAALATLALAIGASTAVFSLVYGVLLRPLDLPRPDRLVLLFEDQSRRGGAAQDVAGIVTVRDWRERTRSFAAIAGSLNNEQARVALTSGGSTEAVVTGKVSARYFATLGVQPLRGREILPAEEVTGSDAVAVLSYGLWQRAFAGRDVLGKSIRIDGRPRTIVGVMPRDLRDPLVPQADLWEPLSLPAGETDRGENGVRIIARLRDGVTVAQARADL